MQWWRPCQSCGPDESAGAEVDVTGTGQSPNQLPHDHAKTTRNRRLHGFAFEKRGAVGIGSKMKVVYRAFVDFSRSCLLWRSSLNVTKSNNQPPSYQFIAQWVNLDARLRKLADRLGLGPLNKNPPSGASWPRELGNSVLAQCRVGGIIMAAVRRRASARTG